MSVTSKFYSLLPTPYSLLPTPCSRLPTPYALFPAPISITKNSYQNSEQFF
ncbi:MULTISPECIES: hypothetical protein [Moorena]|uniref:hypothetical protein n=1 Tax=Moorena TaxID=1155738 RepID=UPI0018E9D84A|nr:MULTISPECIES: hypothetical protein [Moorena]